MSSENLPVGNVTDAGEIPGQKYAIVVQFATPEELRRAMAEQCCRFTLFRQSPLLLPETAEPETQS